MLLEDVKLNRLQNGSQLELRTFLQRSWVRWSGRTRHSSYRIPHPESHPAGPLVSTACHSALQI